MASGYRAYEINGTRYESLADASHADHLLVSALLFKVGVPSPDDAPEIFAVRYDPAVVFPNVRNTRLAASDLVDVFDADTRQRILVDGDPMPPEICDRLLGVLLLKTYGDSIESSTRFLLGSTVESSGSDFFERFNRALDEGDVDLGAISVKEFQGTHLLVDRSAGKPSIDLQTKPYSPAETQEPPRRRTSEPAQSAEQATSGEAETERDERERVERWTRQQREEQSSRRAPQRRGQQRRQKSGASDAASRPNESAFDDPSNIATGAEVDPNAEHVPDDVARDIERLRASVDEDHDFGASYDFTPSTIDSPTDTADVPVAGATDAQRATDVQTSDLRPEDLDDVSEDVASEVATSSLDYKFGPLRSIDDDLGVSSGYRFGPSRSLEEDLGAGVSRTWAETMENVSRIEDTSASYTTQSYDFGPTSYDVGAKDYNFDTSDLYDFTPPEYGEAGTSALGGFFSDDDDTESSTARLHRPPPENRAPRAHDREDRYSSVSGSPGAFAGTPDKTMLPDAYRAPSPSENGAESSMGGSNGSSSSSVSAGGSMSSIAGDVTAMGSRVMGIATNITGTPTKKTNEGADIGLVFQLFLIICILTGLTYLFLSI